MSADPPRFLHRDSSHGYTPRLDQAMIAEPEAVPKVDQDWITWSAEQRQRQARIAEWADRREQLQRELAWLHSRRADRQVARQLQVIERQLRRVDRAIAEA